MKNNIHIITQATGLTEVERGNMLMEYAQDWMRRYFGDERTITNALNYSKFFWAWWSNQWQIREDDFIYWFTYQNALQEKMGMKGVCKQTALEFYQDMHRVDFLAIVPNQLVVLEVNKLIKIEEEKINSLKNKNG